MQMMTRRALIVTEAESKLNPKINRKLTLYSGLCIVPESLVGPSLL